MPTAWLFFFNEGYRMSGYAFFTAYKAYMLAGSSFNRNAVNIQAQYVRYILLHGRYMWI